MKKFDSYVPMLGLLIACAGFAFCVYVISQKAHEAYREGPKIDGPVIAAPVNDGALPDPTLTPGMVRPGVTKAELCDKDFRTGRIRNVPGSMKEVVRRLYGMTSARDKWCNTEQKCEIDHLVPLLLGGANDPKNLFPQAYEGYWNAHHKDRLEVRMKRLVCAGQVELADAQAVFMTNWIDGYKKYIAPEPREARRGDESAD
jgi:hypothetical protein